MQKRRGTHVGKKIVRHGRAPSYSAVRKAAGCAIAASWPMHIEQASVRARDLGDVVFASSPQRVRSHFWSFAISVALGLRPETLHTAWLWYMTVY